MNREEIKEFLNNNFKSEKFIRIFQTIRNKYPEINNEIIKSTSYLEKCTFNERLYNILNDIYERPKCRICDNLLKFKSFNEGYNIYCSNRCSYKDPLLKEKRMNTNLKKYGHVTPLGNENIKEKIYRSNLKKYGVKNISQNKDIREKVKKTCLEKFGVEYSFQSEEVKKKCIEKHIENFGVDNPMKSEIVKKKSRESCLEKFGVEYATQSDIIKQKTLITNLNKYNGHHSKLQSEKNKKIITSIKNFGVDHQMKSEIVKNKLKETFIERYGVDNPMKLEEFKEKLKQSVFNKYGKYYISQTDFCKENFKQTCLRKYGYTSFTKHPKFRKRQSIISKQLWKDPEYAKKVIEWKFKYFLSTGRHPCLGKVGITENGTIYESYFEKEVFEFLERNNIDFDSHVQIPNSCKVSDIVIDNIWIELDGMNRKDNDDNSFSGWNGKLNIYNNLKNNNIINDYLIFSNPIEFIEWFNYYKENNNG